jgi:hypothetical protein
MCQLCRQNNIKTEYQPLLHNEYNYEDEFFSPFLPSIATVALPFVKEQSEKVIVANAIKKGVRDENNLTNIIFYERHKELSGRKLVPGQPNYGSLSTEWLKIRDTIVRPLLPKQQPLNASSYELKGYMQRVKDIIPAIEQYRGRIPLEFILGWIKIESGGVVTTIPIYKAGHKDLNERGYFQISKEESQKLKFDHPRLSTDKAYSVQCGITLINSYANSVRALGINESNPMFWQLVKLWHAASGIARTAVKFALQKRYPFQSWNDFKNYILEREWKNFETMLAWFNHNDKRSYVIRLFNNVDHLFKWAEMIKNQ